LQIMDKVMKFALNKLQIFIIVNFVNLNFKINLCLRK
jgi:hypothetical protein